MNTAAVCADNVTTASAVVSLPRKAINEICVEMLAGDYEVVRHVEVREK
jgi:hypothetical protein